MVRRKVYIVDYELMSPIAVGAERLTAALDSGCSAEHAITRMNAEGVPFKKAAEIREELSGYYAHESAAIQHVCKYDRCLELLAACYGKASGRMAPLTDLLSRERTGVILGIGAGVTRFELFEE